ncbi:glycoside hydrolase family 3 N-terminal domain-containing protein [Pseudoxanthomonas winnipegensis]|uniref:beta-glucosidase n=1 Tax=Pseudoxanthomonas winnipegensis TaxID=2480810 RepID=A0A4Q8M2H8_9GAMM|nr:glycoside hydrolase family 3 N-terminal domain-containing protein [Pseudoxanthomonas winnipegensis]TAA41513.1 beta-glucosidase [Pseudoxanthomonas winnipegensis]
MTQHRITRRQLLTAAGAATLLSQLPMGLALGRARDGAKTPAFIDDLIGRMSLVEKAGQLTLMASASQNGAAAAANPISNTSAVSAQVAAVKAGQLTGVFNSSNVLWHERLQKAAMQSRLKIPMLFAADVIHGFTTVFPVPLGEAASFEPELARRTARAAAMEASAVGIDWTFAPMVDIARDARWGRGVEGSGEDVLLGRRMAAARVHGFQGERGLADPEAVVACPKHFCAYGAAEGGLDYNTTDVSERVLRQTYFPPFQAGFDAGAMTTMASFNEISGIPATANHWLLDDVLRGEWDFTGVVVSDYTGDEELIAHGFARDGRDAARLAILAGVDMSMQSALYLKHLPSLVESGEVPMAVVDRSVRRVLQLKAQLGLFDDPFRRIKPSAPSRQRLPETLELAREAARKSVVLLKNEHYVLPLRTSGQRIALIGPLAQDWDSTKGPWTLFEGDDTGSDLATGMKQTLADPSLLQVVAGCGYQKPLAGGVQEAVAAARAADVVVMAIGESRDDSGEARSRTSITVPQVQQDLLDAVAATGKPVVVVLGNGRALALGKLAPKAHAVLVGWYLGSRSGLGLCDVLFGAHGPSARLPVSFPRESGQVPYYYDHKTTGRPDPEPEKLSPFKTRYMTAPNSALFPFGHGLTYGRIEYGGLDIGDGRLPADGALTVRATISNRGSHAAEEVVQLYVHDRVASITRPVQELKDFRKIRLEPGASAQVEFTLRRADLLFIGQDLKPTVEPGLFDVWVAPSAEVDGLHGTFELLG